MLSATPRRLLLAALVLLAPAYDAAFLLPKRGGGQSSSAGAGASTQQEGGWRGGLGRLLAEAVEGVSGGPKKEGGAAAHPSLQRADELLRKRGASNYREAYKLLKETFGNLPDVDHDVKLKVAKASVSYLRTATNANAVMVDGISDCEENRRLWREYAYEAYDLLKDVHKARPDDPHVHVLMAEAYTYRTSSKGIVKAAVTGDGLTFMKYVKQIVTKYPWFDEGVPHIYDGAFKLAAPWPLRDVSGAVKAFQRAVEVQPRSLRNNYFLGVAHYHNSEFEEAKRRFKYALTEAESLAHTEVDVRDFFMRESKRALGLLEGKLAQGGEL